MRTPTTYAYLYSVVALPALLVGALGCTTENAPSPPPAIESFVSLEVARGEKLRISATGAYFGSEEPNATNIAAPAEVGLRQIGRGGALLSTSGARPAMRAERAEIEHPNLVEWFKSTPRGLEHGIDLPAPPAANRSEPLRLRVHLLEAAAIEIDTDGLGATATHVASGTQLRYHGLFVSDARGQRLRASMEAAPNGVDIVVSDEGALYPITIDPFISIERSRLDTTDLSTGGNFGRALAIEGDLAVVGAADEDGDGTSSGAAYVFRRGSAGWALEQRLISETPDANERFGAGVAIDGSRILVGAPGHDTEEFFEDNVGAIMVFTRSGSAWAYETTIMHDLFDYQGVGHRILIDGDRMYAQTPSAIAAFDRSGASWVPRGGILPPDPGVGFADRGNFAIKDDVAFVGAVQEATRGNNGGAVYQFQRSGSAWEFERKLFASDEAASWYFGSSVSYDGTHLLVGATLATGARGWAYVFARDSGGEFAETVKLSASDGAASHFFGTSALVHEGRLYVGAFGSNTVYVYEGGGASWTEVRRIRPLDVVGADRFGTTITAHGNQLLASSVGRTSFRGTAYVFTVGLESGDPCTYDAQCATGFCVDSVCCNEACDSGCGACTVAGGASADGTCTAVRGGEVCRAIVGACDVEDRCDGVSTACADAVVSAGMECRSAAGVCDTADLCDGVRGTCADLKLGSTTTCRVASGDCDEAERCDGVGDDCPPDVVKLAGIVCRAAAGGCDPAETCDGATGTCPADLLAMAGTVCRTPSGLCDFPETCTGTATACPTDVLHPTGHVCRAALSACDLEETCDGATDACPTDARTPAGTTCRPAANACDIAELCTGTSGTCPTDLTMPGCCLVDGDCDDDSDPCTTPVCSAGACGFMPVPGCSADAGVTGDSGTPRDSGAAVDSGAAGDSGAIQPDAGADGGARADSGAVPPPDDNGGCDCAAVRPSRGGGSEDLVPGLLGLSVFLGLLARRSRRRGR